MLIHVNSYNRVAISVVINSSYSGWNKGVIRPLAKPGKDKGMLASYHPVCLINALA